MTRKRKNKYVLMIDVTGERIGRPKIDRAFTIIFLLLAVLFILIQGCATENTRWMPSQYTDYGTYSER